MNVYLVGGAVRDALLNLEVKDRDWVIVGATIADLTRQRYQQVGTNFPVFLHPDTHEEYALARTERKSGKGYTGFICDFSPSVTLEEDLGRRDLTINAIAQAKDGSLIDPYQGQADIKARLLRHVSEAFTEDPLRVLRVARFAARFHRLGFNIASETKTLMRHIALSGELEALTPERVWLEWEKSLATENPDVFISCLHECGALAIILPEINTLFNQQSQNNTNKGALTLSRCQAVCKKTEELPLRFSALLYELAQDAKEDISAISTLCKRLRVPSIYRDTALMLAKERFFIEKSYKAQTNEFNAIDFIELFDRIDGWRKPHRVEQIATACRLFYLSDEQATSSFSTDFSEQAALNKLTDFLTKAFIKAAALAVKPIIDKGFKGEGIKKELKRQRIEIIEYLLKSTHFPT